MLTRGRCYGLLLSVALLAGVLIVLFLPLATSPGHPKYQGKPLDYWLSQLPLADIRWVGGSSRVSIVPRAAAGGRTYGSTLETPEASLKAIQEMGTNAIPFVFGKLQRRLSPIQKLILKVYSWRGGKRRLFADTIAERRQAVTALLCLSPLPEEWVGRIRKLSTNGHPETRMYAQAVLIGGHINQHTNEIMTWNPKFMPDLR
jgi:hypothetical protein